MRWRLGLVLGSDLHINFNIQSDTCINLLIDQVNLASIDNSHWQLDDGILVLNLSPY